MQDHPAGPWPAPSEADWQRLAQKSLAGQPLSTLAAKIEPGIAIDPLLPAVDRPPLWSRSGRAWTRLQRLGRGTDATTIASALATGADGFEVVSAGSAADYGDGLSPAALAALLADAPLDRGHWRLSGGSDGEALANAVDAAVADGRLDPQLLMIAFGLDPITAPISGRSDAADMPAFAALVTRLAARGYGGPFACADARLVHAAGGTPSMELGYALAALLAQLRALLDCGTSEDVAARAIDVALAADEDQFVTIAKFRAIRLLHARLFAAGGLPRQRLALHAETSWRMLAAEDMNSNLIRTTIAALAAGLGGADSLTVLPFTAAVEPHDVEAERLALTTQAVLIEEARLARVADPGAGSGTIEALTEALAEEGWRRFQMIERDGGLFQSSAWERLQADVAEAAEARQTALASGERGIVGVTHFRAEGAGRPEPPIAGEGGQTAGLHPRRTSAPFEGAAS
ncbi:methylmalonyl-CoA mutase family protein [Mesorhizobium sp. BR1-1-16]|uniref:methylmalonyl-CoA mutase family protein n=1 Tax=Mesorhizobium sp. BR1-1-16 TaxID=2876653 RepID=UPI001CCEE4FF|nr:methylmalonyl-CoA mutase family protein [Mesorhizobium sp. BR1-1-16]MBZ9934941.1 methylmalonyl-CoA mutase family protein [Mesorhizobium sp. BR1-1-16]